ncbi:MAG: glycerol-3-phosphate acyltransferase [Candidatus Omnitrophota bacterium]
MQIISIFKVLAGMLICYLLGAVPVAYLMVKALKGVDIRDYGSGNVGATNAARVIGKLPALAVLCFDLVKGIIAVTLISFIFTSLPGISDEGIKALFGLSVVCGHIFNVFLNFKAGKGEPQVSG